MQKNIIHLHNNGPKKPSYPGEIDLYFRHILLK